MSSHATSAALTHDAPLILCGGGTGGHVYPALAVAAELHGPVVYVGSHDGMEAALVRQESGLHFHGLPAAALRGRGPLAMARNGLVLASGTGVALRLLRELRPAAILGTGGYVCVPLFAAARMIGVPTVIYLPDVVPGLAIRLLARLATVVACNVVDSAPFFGQAARLVVTGYPVRRELFDREQRSCQASFGLTGELPVLLVYGGSRGARSLNRAVEALLPELVTIAEVIHVCGREGDESWLRAAGERLPEGLRGRYRLFAYLGSDGQGPTMLGALGAADLALCRSGASTLAELPAAALPAILVPYPYVHQEENADYLVRHGAAVKISDDQLPRLDSAGDGLLLRELRRLLTDEVARQAMADRSHALARPDAAAALATILRGLAARK